MAPQGPASEEEAWERIVVPCSQGSTEHDDSPAQMALATAFGRVGAGQSVLIDFQGGCLSLKHDFYASLALGLVLNAADAGFDMASVGRAKLVNGTLDLSHVETFAKPKDGDPGGICVSLASCTMSDMHIMLSASQGNSFVVRGGLQLERCRVSNVYRGPQGTADCMAILVALDGGSITARGCEFSLCSGALLQVGLRAAAVIEDCQLKLSGVLPPFILQASITSGGLP